MSDDGQSLSSIELRSLRRRSTVESGRQSEAYSDQPKRGGILGGFFGGRTETHQDAIQNMFAVSMSEIKNANSTRQKIDLQHLRRLSKEYGKFKERPAARCHQFFSYWNFAEKAQNAITTSEYPGRLDKHFHELLEDEENVSAWMCRVASLLKVEPPNGFQLITIAEEPGSEDLPSFFSFGHFTQATIRGNLKTIHSEPVWVLLFVVAASWGIYLQPWESGYDAQEAHELSRPLPLMPPSLRSAHVTPRPSLHIRWGSRSRIPGNLDPNRGDNEIYLSWLRSVASFKRDLNVYIWEPHTRFPSTEYAKIILSPPHNQGHVMRALISLSSCRLHAAYNGKRDACSAQNSGAMLWDEESQTWSNALLSVLCVLEVLASDTDEFLQAYHHETARMRVVSRQNPTISKLRFMMHLEDMRKLASGGLKHATKVLDNLVVLAEQNIQAGTESRAVLLHAEKMAALREDLEFCDQELERLGSYINADQQILRQHFQLSQDLTLFRLTLLAAIFLPLSFTTSLFGMNMRGQPEGLEFLSNITKSTLDLIPDVDFRNSSQAIVSMIASSGTYQYEWGVFAGTAIGLLFILPFTLAVGSIMRVTVISVVRYAKYWRALTLVAGGVLLLAVATTSIFGRFISNVIYNDLLDDAYIPENWLGLYDKMSKLIGVYLAINGLLLVMLIYLVYQSWSEGKERFFWTTQLLNTAVFFTIDILGSAYPFPCMIIPWVWLGLFNPWVRRRWWKAAFAMWR